MTNDIDDGHHQKKLYENHERSPGRTKRSNPVVAPLRHRKKSRHGGHDRHKKDACEKKSRTHVPIPKVAAVLEHEDGPFFFIDRKGDPQNVIYGGNHTATTPRYRKAGYGSLIGTDRHYKISHDGSKAFGIGSSYDGPRRGHVSSLLNFTDKSRVDFGQVKAQTGKGEDDGIRLQHEYVTLSSQDPKLRKRNAAQAVLESTLGTVMDVSKHPQRVENSPVGSDTESESDTSSEDEDEEDLYSKFVNDAERKHLLELNRATLEHPGDADTWLAFIAHQDHMHENLANHGGSVATSKETFAKIKLTLYERALTKVMDRKSRERLIKGLMDQGANIWDNATLSKKWQSVLKENSSSELWIRYINFQQTITMSFSYVGCLSTYKEGLRIAQEEADLTARDELCIYLLLRSTTLMSQSGYSERSTAIWQSLLEFTFFRPDGLDSSMEHSSFQAFWDYEVPRIGEPGATGWALSKPSEILSKSDPAPGNSSSADGYLRWALCEGEVSGSSIMPARTLDDVAEDDPFRVIIYSDIEEYLFRPSTAIGKGLMINAFLKYCGLPSIYYSGLKIYDKWWGDEFLSQCIPRNQNLPIEGTALSDTMTLFPTDIGLSTFPTAVSEHDMSRVAWQRLALKQLATALVDADRLAEYLVAFEASIDIREGRKVAKSLLKNRPSNLRLYNAYALLECRLDRFESAEHVWSTAINMCQSASTCVQQDMILVWSSWVFECLRRGNASRAEMILSSIPNGRVVAEQLTQEPFSNTAVQLRTKNYLESMHSQQLSLRQEDVVLQLTELLAMFEYLAGSHSVSKALEVYNTTFEALAELPASSLQVELLHQSRARLLHIHPAVSPHGYRPAVMNRYLAESLSKFTSNSMFHQLYQEHTQRTGLLERIREVVPGNISSDESNKYTSSIMPYLFAIHKELCRPSYAGSTAHSIRAVFERGVAAAKASVGIWSWYIKWELSLSVETDPVPQTAKPRKRDIGLGRNKAVDVYYRGIHAAPWAKDLYMLAFSEAPLREALGDTELRKIYDTMLEKGLRLHVDLDQIMH
jgi:hypothetical protein